MKASEMLNLHREQIRSLAKNYEKRKIRNLRVFGSVVHGNDTEKSDIDIVIDTDDDIGLFAVGGLQYELESILGKPVDLIMSDSIPSFYRDKILNSAEPI